MSTRCPPTFRPDGNEFDPWGVIVLTILVFLLFGSGSFVGMALEHSKRDESINSLIRENIKLHAKIKTFEFFAKRDGG